MSISTVSKAIAITIGLFIVFLFTPIFIGIIAFGLVFGIVYLSLKDLKDKKKPP